MDCTLLDMKTPNGTARLCESSLDTLIHSTFPEPQTPRLMHTLRQMVGFLIYGVPVEGTIRIPVDVWRPIDDPWMSRGSQVLGSFGHPLDN